jgi:serine/threonine protein kinase
MGEGQKTVGRYVIDCELGRGGMGVVYKAHDTERNIDVAIKTIPPELAHHPEFLQRFQQEARALMRLHHPHIVSLIDLLQDQGNHYMVLEYVDGPSLSQLLAKGPLPPERASEIALQVAGALSYSHAHNIVHRDIKTSNILLTKEGLVKVTDFGIARILDATLGTLTGKVFGTARYASPEQVKGLKVDHRSDLYSLGVVLYEMLAGRPPFLGTDDELMEQHIRAEPVPPSRLNEQVPAFLETVTLRCLEKDRDSRYQRAEDLAANLRRAKVGTKPGVGEKPKGGRDKRQPIVAFAAITAILVVALVALAVVIWPRPGGGTDDTTVSDVGDATPSHRLSPTATSTEAPASPAETKPPAATPTETTIVPTPTPFVGQIAFLSDRDHQDVQSPYSWPPVELYLMNPDGSNRRRLTWGTTALSDTGLPPRRVFWVDENVVAVNETGTRDRALLVNAADGNVKETIQFTTTAEGMEVYGFLMDWSPDGSRVALDGMNSDTPANLKCALWISDPHGTNWNRITDWKENCDYGPTWSPDGTWLAFARLNPAAKRGLYLIHPDGSGLRLLSAELHYGDTRAWSPDGQFIASDMWTDADIVIVNVQTREVNNVTSTPNRAEQHPSWSPDGTQIAFEVRQGTREEIWVMNADGTDPHKIADGCRPAWQPAPWIAGTEAAEPVVSQQTPGAPPASVIIPTPSSRPDMPGSAPQEYVSIGQRVTDPSGDVTEAYVDVVAFTSTLSGERLGVTFELRDVPSALTFDRVGIPSHRLEYKWAVYVDVDGDQRTGSSVYWGAEYWLGAVSLVRDPRQPVTLPLVDGLEAWVMQNNPTDDSWKSVTDAAAQVSFQEDRIVLAGTIPGISSASRVLFKTLDYLAGGDMIG